MRSKVPVMLVASSLALLAACSSDSGGGSKTGGSGGGGRAATGGAGGGGTGGAGGSTGGAAGGATGGNADGGVDVAPTGGVGGKGGGGGSLGGAGGGGGAGGAVARGEYLVKSVLGCAGCHTPSVNGAPDMTKFLGGNDCFTKDTATGDCLASANLTNDPTGIKDLTDQQVMDAFRKGIDPEKNDGGTQYLFSQMPYYQFANLTDADAQAIVSYLRSVPPVAHEPAANGNAFATQPTSPQWLPAALADLPSASTDAGTGAANGKYLAALMCATCHTVNTGTTSPFQIDVSKAYQGGKAATTRITVPATGAGGAGGAGGANGAGGSAGGAAGAGGGAGGAGGTMTISKTIQSSNLTPDSTGLGDWTVQQIVTAIKMGKDEKGRSICSPMRSYPTLSDQDATDIATYLKAIPGVNHPITMTCE